MFQQLFSAIISQNSSSAWQENESWPAVSGFGFVAKSKNAPRIKISPALKLNQGLIALLGHFFLSLFIELVQLFEELSLGFHNGWLVASTLGAEPSSFGFRCQLNTLKMEPFYRTEIIVAPDHVAVGHLKRIRRYISRTILKHNFLRSKFSALTCSHKQ